MEMQLAEVPSDGTRVVGRRSSVRVSQRGRDLVDTAFVEIGIAG